MHDEAINLLVMLPWGVIPLLYGFYRILWEMRPVVWKKITGTVISSTISRKPPPKFHGNWKSLPVIEYEYCYDAKVYRSKRINALNYTFGNKRGAQKIISRYPAGNTTTVFINPNCPSNSVLEYGITPGTWVFVVYGLMISALAIGLAPL
jgi:hypothetical protein